MPKSFYKINIEITNVCNLQCSFCPEVIRSKKLMDLPLFKRVIEQVKPLTQVVTLHLMGDPLVHPKLNDFVAVCEEVGLQIFFVTNGVLLGEKEKELLCRPVFRQVSFSLHSFPDNFGDKDPTVYLENIFEFTERAMEKSPRLFINYRLWNLADPKGKNPKNTEILRLIEKRFGMRISESGDTRIKRNQVLKGRLSVHFDVEFTWPALSLPILGEEGTCQGLKSHFGILVDGTVVPCCLDKEGSIPLGNIQDSPLSDILGSSRARRMLEGFRAGVLVEDLCQRCQYIERFQPDALSSSL